MGSPRRLDPELGWLPGESTPEGDAPAYADAIDPWWFVPGGLPALASLPRLWLDWLIDWSDPVPRPDWRVYEQAWPTLKPGTRLFWSPVRARGRRTVPGWLMVPTPPLYGAHRLGGWPRPKKDTPESDSDVEDLSGLRWIPWPEGEESRSLGGGRPALRGVWPNVMTVDWRTGWLVAVPWTSHVAAGSDPGVAEGLPCYPMHLPDFGMPVVDPRLRARWWESQPYPIGAGGFQMGLVDGRYGDSVALARQLASAANFHSRADVLRRSMDTGATTAQCALALRRPAGDDPGSWLVLSVQYPNSVLWSTGGRGPKDTGTLRYCQRLVSTVVTRALPGIDATDVGRRRPVPGAAPGAHAAAAALRRSVICAIEEWRSLQGLRRDRFSTPSAGPGSGSRAVSLLLHDKEQAFQAVEVLARGWDNDQWRELADRWNDPAFQSPFDAPLQWLAATVRGGPPEGRDDLPWIRQVTLRLMARGLSEPAFRQLAAAEADPQSDCTLLHWSVFLAFCMLVSGLPLRIGPPS